MLERGVNIRMWKKKIVLQTLYLRETETTGDAEEQVVGCADIWAR